MNVDGILLDMHDDGELDDEEVLLLMHENQHRNLHANLPYDKYDRFDVEFYTEGEFEVKFRFHKRDINRLAAAFQLSDSFKCVNGVIVDGVEALCVTLKRLAFPGTMTNQCCPLDSFKYLPMLFTIKGLH
eukprot:gene8716-biopygen9714